MQAIRFGSVRPVEFSWANKSDGEFPSRDKRFTVACNDLLRYSISNGSLQKDRLSLNDPDLKESPHLILTWMDGKPWLATGRDAEIASQYNLAQLGISSEPNRSPLQKLHKETSKRLASQLKASQDQAENLVQVTFNKIVRPPSDETFVRIVDIIG